MPLQPALRSYNASEQELRRLLARGPAAQERVGAALRELGKDAAISFLIRCLSEERRRETRLAYAAFALLWPALAVFWFLTRQYYVPVSLVAIATLFVVGSLWFRRIRRTCLQHLAHYDDKRSLPILVSALNTVDRAIAAPSLIRQLPLLGPADHALVHAQRFILSQELGRTLSNPHASRRDNELATLIQATFSRCRPSGTVAAETAARFSRELR